MFTVIIAEKENIEAIEQSNKLFFEPFLQNRDLAFCCWNPQGQTLTESVPSLGDTVGRRRQWRAVILNAGTPEQLSRQNPFDVVDYSALRDVKAPAAQPEEGENWENWVEAWKAYYAKFTPLKEQIYSAALRTPLTKLATWMCFQPANYVLENIPEKQDAYEWALEKLCGDELKRTSRLEVMERDLYHYELRLKERLRREFIDGGSINISHPAEVYCVSKRITEGSFFNPESYWKVRRESQYSDFSDRNMYFDKMRFMVFDVLPEAHRNYRSSMIRFLYAVLVFASNRVPGSAMQARRLYQLDTENDDTPLCTLATSYEKKLSKTYEIIENEIGKIQSELPGELTDREAEALFCTSAEVTVSLDKNCDTDALFADQEFPLTANPAKMDETAEWKKSCSDSEKALGYILKQQDRSLKKSVDKVKIYNTVSSGNIRRLNHFQLDDIRDYTEAAENEMIEALPPGPCEKSKYSARIQDKTKKVQDILESRMTKKATLGLSFLCLGLYFLTFLPFLFSNFRRPPIAMAALITILITTSLLGGVMLVTLIVFRHKLRVAADAFNGEMKTILLDIQKTLQKFGSYLSLICNVRKGYGVLKYSEQNPDEYTRSIRIRRKHQEDIRRKRAYLEEEYQDFIAGTSFCDKAMSSPYTYDFNQETEFDYPAPFLAGDCHQIAFLESGNIVTVPSGYVTKISVKMEEIYDE